MTHPEDVAENARLERDTAFGEGIVSPEALADELVGTCATCVVEERLATQADVEAFDNLAFLCECCGWWCATEELHNEGAQNLCEDCNEDENGDGDYDDASGSGNPEFDPRYRD